MNKPKIAGLLTATLLTLSGLNGATADEVRILGAEFQSSGDNRWSVNVTLKHRDTGWEHYADSWRVVDGAGTTLGNRVLYHPHVDEQPFTRGLDSVLIPAGVTTVFIEAHDKVHLWSPHRLEVDLRKTTDGRLRVAAD